MIAGSGPPAEELEMFTGIVEEVGEIVGVAERDDVVALTISAKTVAAGARHGDSIAVNGVCLTVVVTDADTFVVELVPETLRRSSMAGAAAGTRVNLERALAADGRIGGHIVQGHVDAVGEVLGRHAVGRSEEVEFSLPEPVARYVVHKGSIAVDGVSLTVADVAPGRFTVALIPTTLADTTLGERHPGSAVNLEVDVVAKYVERLAAGYLRQDGIS
jgi:riboflavin synthase